jgi:phage tail-like protein
LTVLFVSDVSDLVSETEVVEQKATTPTGQTVLQNLPGRLKWKEIVVRRTLTSDRGFATWRAQVEAGNLKDAIFNFSLTLLGTSLQPVARWEGVGGWPSKLSIIIPPVNPPAGTPVVPVREELTIAHSGLVRVQ